MEGGRNGGGRMEGKGVDFGESWGFSGPYGGGRGVYHMYIVGDVKNILGSKR